MPGLVRTWQASYDPVPRRSSDQRGDVVETGEAQVSAVEEAVRLRNRDRWQQLIDGTLTEMGRNPQAFAAADEGAAAPTQRAIAAAIRFARFAREAMLAAPGQTLPDGDGGLVIQHALPDGATESFEAGAEGRCSIWFYPRAPQKPIQTEIELPGAGDDF